ncbi:MAG: ferritin family protein [Dehalococcoidia bacterium]|jgi:rubrerythrin|nr:ferritin family protein [Dehalococcoidia bacterium]MDP7240001.1 ferritin family protein [Dehalococcoidia bacterium]MDP7470269.1 ferritin family protein [Dehalococcoidia bacterium]
MSLFFSGKEVVDMALRIEANGLAFYRAALTRVKDPSIKAAYQHLATEEERHAREFGRLLASQADVPNSPAIAQELSEYLSALIDSRIFVDEVGAQAGALGVKDDAETVEMGMRMESETILFFTEMRGLVRRDEQAVVDSILGEERDHLRRLSLLRKNLLGLNR